MSLATVRAHLSEALDRVLRTHERITITRHGRRESVIISTEDLEALEETLALLSDPGRSGRSPRRGSPPAQRGLDRLRAAAAVAVVEFVLGDLHRDLPAGSASRCGPSSPGPGPPGTGPTGSCTRSMRRPGWSRCSGSTTAPMSIEAANNADASGGRTSGTGPSILNMTDDTAVNTLRKVHA